MSESEHMVVALGLASALAWGSGDFMGGMATRRSSVLSVITASQLVGVMLLVLAAWQLSEPWPSLKTIALGATAGISGVIGLMALYQGLAKGPMGVVAPAAAVVTAALPVAVGLFTEGWPSMVRMVGFLIALLGVALLSGIGIAAGITVSLSEFKLPLLAGLGFGLFYILVNATSREAILWPLVSARVSSIALLLAIAQTRRVTLLPGSRLMPLIILAGVGDSGGNAFFALATRMGRLDIAAVLGSLYPAVTVILAWLLLQERMSRSQLVGIVLALVSLGMIAY